MSQMGRLVNAAICAGAALLALPAVALAAPHYEGYIVGEPSSEISFEIVQKAAAAGIPVLVAVSAPTSLAVDLAEATGVALLAFARADGVAVYTHPERLELPANSSVTGPGL